jgi:hypothetical protein
MAIATLASPTSPMTRVPMPGVPVVGLYNLLTYGLCVAVGGAEEGGVCGSADRFALNLMH